MVSAFIFYLILISFTIEGYPNVTLDTTTLKTANLFFRHGARTPLVKAPINGKFNQIIFSYDEPGILTKVGKEKMFNLGVKLREMYNEFLSEYYLPTEIHVSTTPVDRTIDSAKSFLAGLYSTEGYKRWTENTQLAAIPIASDDSDIDKSYIVNTPNACPSFRLDQQWSIKKARNEDYGFEKVYNYLSLYAGSQINGMYDIFPAWDTLECLAHNNLNLPYWASTVYPEQLSLITAKVLRSMITGTKKMIRLSAGPYIAEIHKQFTNAEINKPSNVKLVVHGGHDFSMTANLGALGVLEKIVNPSDAILLELHCIPFAGNFVQFHYIEDGGSKLATIPIKGCGQPCPLYQFLIITKDVIPYHWDLECSGYS